MSQQQGEGSDLRFNPEAEELVREDLREVLAEQLEAAPGFEAIVSAVLDRVGWSVVRWQYTGNSDGRFLDLGVPFQGMVMHGVTLVERDGKQFHRFIDWAGVYTQLGLSLSWRQAVPVEDPVGGYSEPNEPG